MSRFEQYLEEDRRIVTVEGVQFSYKDIGEFVKAWNLIESNLKKYMRLFKKLNYKYEERLWRGHRHIRGNFEEKRPRGSRIPKDTPIEWHEALDWAFENIHGWYARSEGVFCFGSYGEASSYGTPHMMFPIGKFSFLYSEEWKDLYASNIIGDNGVEYLTHTDLIEEKWQLQWEEEYGEGEEGNWTHPQHPQGLGNDKESAIDSIIEWLLESIGDPEDYDLEDEDEREEYERIVRERREVEKNRYQIEEVLEWEPYMDWFRYYDEKVESAAREGEYDTEAYQNAAEQIVKEGHYKHRRLGEAIRVDHEIMIKCDKYYMMVGGFSPLVNRVLAGHSPDPRQLEMDFM